MNKFVFTSIFFITSTKLIFSAHDIVITEILIATVISIFALFTLLEKKFCTMKAIFFNIYKLPVKLYKKLLITFKV